MWLVDGFLFLLRRMRACGEMFARIYVGRLPTHRPVSKHLSPVGGV